VVGRSQGRENQKTQSRGHFFNRVQSTTHKCLSRSAAARAFCVRRSGHFDWRAALCEKNHSPVVEPRGIIMPLRLNEAHGGATPCLTIRPPFVCW
jgi:hypothetical protein